MTFGFEGNAGAFIIVGPLVGTDSAGIGLGIQ